MGNATSCSEDPRLNTRNSPRLDQKNFLSNYNKIENALHPTFGEVEVYLE